MSERPSMEQINEWVARQAERDVAWAARMRAHQERYAEFCKQREERRAAEEAAAAARQEQLAKEQAERAAKMWPAEKLQRSRADWEAITGNSRLAAQQCAWERTTTVLAMRAAGLTLREIGERYGLSPERIRQIIAKAERKRLHPAHRTHLSPVEEYLRWNAALGMTTGQPPRQIRRMVATLALINHTATPRDWLHVGTTVREQVLPVLTVQATGADDAVRTSAGRRPEACHG